MAEDDIWSRWILERRVPTDAKVAEEWQRNLARLRAKVLEGARIQPGETVLDVGAGDGLISFGAAEAVGPGGRVIVSDISEPLLEHCRGLARKLGIEHRCAFVQASADDLGAIPDASVDVVTVRSVLIYVADKAACFRAFHRVLRPGGRISLFEPIGRMSLDFEQHGWWRNDSDVADLERRVADYFRSFQPPDSDPMLDFDERTLLRDCMAAGFREISMTLDVEIRQQPTSWEALASTAGNPKIPSLREAIDQLFTPEEAARYERAVRADLDREGTTTFGASIVLRAEKQR